MSPLVRLIGGPRNGKTINRLDPLPPKIEVTDPRAPHKRLTYRRQPGGQEYAYEGDPGSPKPGS